MTVYDTHFHLDDKDDAQAIITRAREAGVDYMNLISCTIKDSHRNLKIAEENKIFTTAGVHPLNVDEFDGDFEAFRPFYESDSVVAVGEIGLDYYYDQKEETLTFQKEVFQKFLQFSAEFKKPAVVHCRDAFEDTYNFIKEFIPREQPFVIHCYTGDTHWAEKFVELGAYISYSGIVTFKNAESLRDSLKVVPKDRILIETDSPYLAPVPLRGRRNEPANVVHVRDRVAFELGMSKEDLSALTLENGQKAFSVS
ncbi:MAG: TatD family hydrolase [Lentisphaeraceae bacterium]|nr:TatD family hydrolase [Lentisphaeraceae bacterium]